MCAYYIFYSITIGKNMVKYINVNEYVMNICDYPISSVQTRIQYISRIMLCNFLPTQ